MDIRTNVHSPYVECGAYHLVIIIGTLSVSHDTNEMILNGGFTYNQDNQRALPFKVAISRMKDSDVYRGHNSKLYLNTAPILLLYRRISPWHKTHFIFAYYRYVLLAKLE